MNAIRSEAKLSSQWDLTTEELSAFYSRLDNERHSMNLSIEQIRSAELIVSQRSEEEVIGIAGIRRVRHLPVAFFVVREPFQGQGIGNMLVHCLHDVMRKSDYRIVFLSVSRSNLKALRLYKTRGYRIFFANADTLYMFCPLWRSKQ